jgi:predicted DNA-binding transcriptional regulator AlpA
MIKDYSESLHVISRSQRALYEALQDGEVDRAIELTNEIIYAAREIRAWVTANEAQRP